MKLLFSFLILVLCFSSQAKADCTIEFEMNGAIGPATLDFFERVQNRAEKKNCSSILALINTPGGSLQTTRLLVEEILNSPRPVLCLVHPSGGHAGSAGAIILQACHVSGAMIATNIGAATPIAGSGQEMPEDLRKKLLNDTRSWLEGITKLRGRSIKFGQDIILEAKAVDAKKAKELGAIDFVAEKKNDFVEFAKNREVKMSEDRTEKVVVGTLERFDADFRHKVVSFITDPQTSYILLMGSLGLLYFEITHPGMIVPGVIGGVGIVLALVSMHKLDVAWGGLLLILLGLAFMIAEAFLPSFGVLGVGGVASFIIGSIFLFDPETTGYQLPLSVILPTAITLGLITFAIAWMAYKTLGRRRTGGYDDLIGSEGRVVEVRRLGREGQIEILGETWKFKSKTPVENDSLVQVTGYKGLTLKVEPRGE